MPTHGGCPKYGSAQDVVVGQKADRVAIAFGKFCMLCGSGELGCFEIRPTIWLVSKPVHPRSNIHNGLAERQLALPSLVGCAQLKVKRSDLFQRKVAIG